MHDEPDVVEDSRPRRELAPRARVVVSLLCCAVVVALVGGLAAWARTTSNVSSGGSAGPAPSVPVASPGLPRTSPTVPSLLGTYGCGCVGEPSGSWSWLLEPGSPSGIPASSLATASYPQSETSTGTLEPEPTGPGLLQAWPQVQLLTADGVTVVEAPVDAQGSPVFPTAMWSQIQTIQVPGAVVFAFVTLTTRPADGNGRCTCDEYEVAHVRLYDRVGDYSFSPSDFTFEPAGRQGDFVKPLPTHPGTEYPLQPGTLHAGQSAAGDLVFDVPRGGGDLSVTGWLGSPGGVPVGQVYGPWHVDS